MERLYRPTDKEPFMSERQREYFRLKLLDWREDILKEAKETLQHLQDESQNHPDLADRASSETDRAIELRARDRQRKLIAKIDAALQRIEDGTYGYCEETGEPISHQAARGAPDRDAVDRGAGTPRAPRAGLSRRTLGAGPGRRRGTLFSLYLPSLLTGVNRSAPGTQSACRYYRSMLGAMRNTVSQLPQPNISRLLRRALGAHEAGETAAAERLYAAVLDDDPDNFDALHGLGRLHCQRGRFDTALVLIREALKSDGGRADGFASLGLVLHLLRRFNEALASYDAGLCIAPDDAELLIGAAWRFSNSAGRATRLRASSRSGRRSRSPRRARQLRQCIAQLNRPAQALAAYERALTTTPENAQLLTNRAVALRRLDRPHDALMSASRALSAGRTCPGPFC